MKKSLFLYLFVVAFIMNVFTYMYYSKRATFEETQFKKTNTNYKVKLAEATSKLAEANYFALENNENAKNYFDSNSSEKSISFEKLIPFVKEKLMDLNANANGNPYTGQDKIGNQKFIINKIKVLNHRWIIADYSDGTYWGEVLLKYFVNEDETISFETIQSILYQK